MSPISEWEGWKKIKYEGELAHGFADEIVALPGGEKLKHCIQCGTCSGMCPLSSYMDYTPRRIIAMVRAGFKGEVLGSLTNWLCASCYSCTVECPKDIKITDIMYALKQKAIEEGVYPKRFKIPALAREFFNLVKETGRNSEPFLLMRLYLHTNPFAALKQAGLGMKYITTGRFRLEKDKIKGVDELNKILSAVEAMEV